MKPLLLPSFFALLFFTFTDLSAQRWEAGASLGISTYQGDLIPRNHGDITSARFAYSAFLNYRLNLSFALRASLAGGEITADDRNYPNTAISRRFDRGFSFSSPFKEAAILLEYDVLGHRRPTSNEAFKPLFSVYLLAGGGLASFNPKTDYNLPDTNASQTLIDRDQMGKTNRSYFVTPFGGGLKYDLSCRWTIGVEYLLRPTFDDLIDGVKHAGDPRDDDWYETHSLIIVYRFGNVCGKSTMTKRECLPPI